MAMLITVRVRAWHRQNDVEPAAVVAASCPDQSRGSSSLVGLVLQCGAESPLGKAQPISVALPTILYAIKPFKNPSVLKLATVDSLVCN